MNFEVIVALIPPMLCLTLSAVLLLAGCSAEPTAVPTVEPPTEQATGILAEFPQLSAENDWPWWRGPWRNGYAHPSARPPVKFSDTENVVWKSPISGRGHSSPVVVGPRIFLATADDAAQTQSVVALDRTTGRLLWQKQLSQGGFPRIHSNNTHASPTVACDGERVIVTFHHHDTLQAVALDPDGNVLWDRAVGEFHPKRYEYGYGPSPVVYRGTVLVAAEYDGPSFLTALDRRTGATVWKTPRPANVSYSSPGIHTIGGRDLLAISGADKVAAYDPMTGRTLWEVPGTTAATCGTTVADGDIVFASGGYPKAETVAVRAGAAGGEVLWKNAQKCYEQSMIVHDGYLYMLTDNGGLFCFRGRDGAEMWRKRLQGPVSASPVLADGRIYWANERGTMYVFRADPAAFDLLAENRLGDESFASPAVVGEQMFVRVTHHVGGGRQDFVYCLGEKR